MGAPRRDLSARRIDRVCGSHEEKRPMRIALVEELRRSVGFGPYVWALTDPRTEVGVAPLADVPDAVFRDLPGLIRARYLTTINRASTMAGAAESLLRATGGDPMQSLIYREVLAELDVADVATVVFRDGHGWWGWLDLWRSTAEAPLLGG